MELKYGPFATSPVQAKNTLAVMRSNVLEWIADPTIKRTAEQVILYGGAAPRDEVTQCRLLRAWAKSHWYFVNAPVNVQLLKTPGESMQEIQTQGKAQGNCADAAQFIAALCESIGIHCLFYAVAIDGTPDKFDHVFTVAVPRATPPALVELDITRPDSLLHVRFKPLHLTAPAY